MPNWCYNYAHITCPSKDVYDKLYNAIYNDKWFETFAPLPVDDTVCNRLIAIQLWNTKWPPSDMNIINTCDETYTIELSFDTAWTAPIGVYKIMNYSFNIDVHAFYQEPGCEFFGRCCLSKKEEILETFEFPSNAEELNNIRKRIGSELDEYMSDTWEMLQEQWKHQEEQEDEDDEEEDEDAAHEEQIDKS
jgi:hypothetical protein